MSDDQEVIRPATASLDGKTNAFIHHCAVLEQQMHYVACLNRVQAAKEGVRMPQDWKPCEDAVRRCLCPALAMREQEVLKDRAIYFVQRGVIASTVDAVKTWVMPGSKKAKPPASPKPAATSGAGMLDGLVEAAKVTYADVISAVATTFKPLPVTPPKPVPKPSPTAKAKFVSLPGETPLQTALRFKAQLTKENS